MDIEKKKQGSITYSMDRANKANKKFITWLLFVLFALEKNVGPYMKSQSIKFACHFNHESHTSLHFFTAIILCYPPVKQYAMYPSII